MVNYSLKKYIDDDFEFVYELKRDAYKKYVIANWGEWNERIQRDMYAKFIEHVKDDTFIITSNNNNIGFLNCQTLKNGDFEIGNICIVAEYQNKGIGSQILKDLLEQNKDKDIHIQYFKQNPVGSLYKRLGFVEKEKNDTHIKMIKPKQ